MWPDWRDADADGQLLPSGPVGPDLPADVPPPPVAWWEGVAALAAYAGGVWWLLL